MSSMPEDVTLDAARRLAAELRDEFARGDEAAVERVRRVLPSRSELLSESSARHVIAVELGQPDWHAWVEVALDRERGLEWAARRAQKAIEANETDRLEELLSEFPDLLFWRDPESGEVLLQATTSYANSPGDDQEEVWNRPECAELLLNAGALVDSRVVLRILQTGARGMLELFSEMGVLPANLRVAVALGRIESIRMAFDADGKMTAAARPTAELRIGYDKAAQDWPDPEDDEAVLADAFLYACRWSQREIAEDLLARCQALDSQLASKVAGWDEEDGFLDFLLEQAPEGARYSLRSSQANSRPGPVWQCAVDLRLHAALQAGDLATFERWLDTETFFLAAEFVPLQVRFCEVAAYTDGSRAFLEALFARRPALLEMREPPLTQALSYALEYGHADYLPLLGRIWQVPEDLPHAAGRGDLERLARWFTDAGEPNLGDPSAHHPSSDRDTLVSVQNILDRALAWAVQNAEYATADFLLERGADIDTRWGTHEPASILHECAAAGRIEQVRWLVQRGIDRKRRDRRFEATAEEWARFLGRDEVADFLASV